jgi:hypothetical protein
VPDGQSLVNGRVDADADGVADYPYGTDEYLVWEENGNVLANVFIGKVERPVVNGEDSARIYIDTDADPATGYSVGGMGAERMLEFRGKGGIITSANYSIFSGASPGIWAWSLINTPSYMKDSTELETYVAITLDPNATVWFEIEDWDKHRDDKGLGNVTVEVARTRSAEPGAETMANSKITLNEVTSGYGGAVGDKFGWNVSYAGDINGDTIEDVIIGAPGRNGNQGAAYIFFGYSGITNGDLIPANADVTILGATADDNFGWSVSDAGDVNGGGPDIIIGAPGYSSSTGRAYIFYSTTISGGTLPKTISATNADVTITGEATGDKFGASVSGAGNIDAATNDDFIIAAPMTGKSNILTDNFEGGLGAWTVNPAGTWAINNADSHSASNSVYRAYPISVTETLTLATALDLSVAKRPILTFWHKYQSDSVNFQYDDLDIEVSRDNGVTWVMIATYDSTTLTSWAMQNVSLGYIVGYTQTFVRFKIVSSATNTGSWRIDDVSIFDKPGAVYTFYGDGSIPTQASSADSIIIGPGLSTEKFGQSVSGTNDFAGSTNPDIIIGSPGYQNNQGRALVYQGGSLASSTLFTSGFEVSASEWGYYATASRTTTAPAPHSGTYAGRLNGYTSGPYVFQWYHTSFRNYFSRTFDLRNYSEITLSWWWTTVALDSGEYATMVIESDGHAVEIARVTTNIAWTQVTVNLKGYNMSEEFTVYYLLTEYMGLDDFTITGKRGCSIESNSTSSSFGFSVSDAGNFNNAGKSDVIIGAPSYSTNRGTAFIYYGNTNPFPPQVIDNTGMGYYVDQTNTRRAAQSFYNIQASSLICLWINGFDAGTASTTLTIELVNDNADAPTGTVIATQTCDPSGTWTRIQFNSMVSLSASTRYWIRASCTDTAANGYAWICDSVNSYTGGRAYVGTNYAGAVGDDYTFKLKIRPDVNITGEANGDFFGYSVHGAGKIGGASDSYDDIIIGAPYTHNGTLADVGTIYIFNGSATMASAISASNCDYMKNGTQVNGHFGWSVCKAGDLNDDGNNDIIVGSPDKGLSTADGTGWTQVLSVIIPEFSAELIAIFIPLGITFIVFRKRRKREHGEREETPI